MDIGTNVFFSLGLSAKEHEQNKFYSEQDAINEAQRASKALKVPVKVLLWHAVQPMDSISGPPVQTMPKPVDEPVEYALVLPSAEVKYLLPRLAQAAYALLAKGFKQEAQELLAMVTTPAYTQENKLKVLVRQEDSTCLEQEVSAEVDVGVENGCIKLCAFRINGVADHSVDTLVEPIVMMPEQHYDTKAQLILAAATILRHFQEYPLEYGHDEITAFNIQ